MAINKILDLKHIACQEEVNNKKTVLEKLSRLLALEQPELDAGMVFGKLLEREQACGTALGHGIAIPHCRMREAIVAMMTLRDGVNFDAGDYEPVDILLGMVVPENQEETHLQILAAAAEMFSDPQLCRKLRASRSGAQLYKLVHNWRPAGLRA
jgi:PTS system nitrogen regulatory IIA component